MTTLTTIKLWSEADGGLVDFDITTETEEDEGGNEHQVILLKHGDEEFRFSPSYTDEELQRVIDRMNGEYQ